MATRTVTIFGGSGFIGRYIVQRLAKQGDRVRVAVRDPRAANFLKPLGDLGQITPVATSVTDPNAVARAVEDADAVVNLVGILYERGKRTFKTMHEDAARTVAEASAAAGVQTMVHMSALGVAADHPSKYARTKAAGEAAVRQAFPTATILRPSVVFGPEDGFFNLFAAMARISPFLPYYTTVNPADEGGGGPKMQPVYVGDVADATVAALNDPATYGGQTYDLGGPTVYDMRTLMQMVIDVSQRRCKVLPLPMIAASITALSTFVLPVPIITPDQVKLLRVDNVVHGENGFDAFGIEPTDAEAILPTYLKRFRPLHSHKRIRKAVKSQA